MNNKNILSENMRRFGTKNLNEDEYQSPGQLGEIPKLDTKLDQEHVDNTLSRIEQLYSKIKPKRIDTIELRNDVLDLISIYKDKPYATRYSELIKAFYDLYPISKTNTSWRGINGQLVDKLTHLLKVEIAIDQGDTSNFGYRQMKK